MNVAAYLKYNSFRKTSSPLVSSIPDHWYIRRLKYVALMKSDKVVSMGSTLPYIGMESVESWSGRILEGDTEVEGLAATFSKGNVLFGKLRPYLAKVTKPDFDGLCSSEFIVFEASKNTSPDYLAYALRSSDFINFVNGSTYGAKMPRANPGFVANCGIPFPPLPEQRAVAAFLDGKCAAIDEAVRIKEAQIKLLRERRQILIQQAVTRGLNPDAPMKDSGIDWIGQIPAHWEVSPIRSLFGFRNEKNDPVKTENILSLSIASGVTPYSDNNRGGNKRKDDLSAYKIARPDDIVLNSMNVIVGAVGRSKYFGAISPVYYALFLQDSDSDIRYFEYIFSNSSFQRGLLRYGKGILMKLSGTGQLNTIRMKISQNDLKVLPLPLPPKREQLKIVNHLQFETQKIDGAISVKQDQITALKEYKTVLINAAVTGKIKVA